MPRHVLLGGWVAVLVVGVAADRAGAAALPQAYRDFKIYVASKPDAVDASKIHVEAQLHNQGTEVLKIVAMLPSHAV